MLLNYLNYDPEKCIVEHMRPFMIHNYRKLYSVAVLFKTILPWLLFSQSQLSIFLNNLTDKLNFLENMGKLFWASASSKGQTQLQTALLYNRSGRL